MIWSQPPETRLVIWRKFRKKIEQLDLIDAAKATAEWWVQIPTKETISTPWATDSWPDPWNLISDGPLDHTMTSVAMAYTLWMCSRDDTRDRVQLAVINDISKRRISLVVMVDKRWAINYNTGEFTDTSRLGSDFEILSTYAYETFKSRIKA